MTDSTAIAVIDPIRNKLAAAQTIPELNAVKDMAAAAKAWAKSRGLGVEAENEASEYILRAERSIGKMLIALAESGDRPIRNPGTNQYKEAEPYIGLADLGVSRHQSQDFQRLATLLTDEQFDAMLAEARAWGNGTRIAKVNFYRPERRKVEEAATSENKDFELLRKGAFGLLGWQIEDDGFNKQTKNDLTMLPDDELRQMAAIIKALAFAYNEAKAARG